MGNVAGAFPAPYDPSIEVLPTWALAVLTASGAVTLLWAVAFITLVAFQIVGKNRSGEYIVTSTSDGHHRSLGTPPPPVRPPPRRVSPQSSLVSRSSSSHSEVRVNAGYRDSVISLNCDPSEAPESKPVIKETAQLPMVKKKATADGACAVEGATNLASPTSSLSGMVLSRPITVRQLGATLREPNYIDTEFKKLPTPSVSLADCPDGVERKNRYTNVLPSPRTRVSLPLLLGSPATEYINANYMRGYKGSPRRYIATQGPLDGTVEDFWRLVWENRSEVIVMATNFQERGIDKCSRYWPAQGSEQYGRMEVTLLSQTTQPTYNKTRLQIRLVSSDEVRCVDHFRLTAWPQHGVPKDTATITDFLREVKMTESSGPAVVHCSAGIGRTGVLIAVDIGLQAVLTGEGKLDILRIVSTLRQDRAGCVQTSLQYRFVHQCLYDYARTALK